MRRLTKSVAASPDAGLPHEVPSSCEQGRSRSLGDLAGDEAPFRGRNEHEILQEPGRRRDARPRLAAPADVRCDAAAATAPSARNGRQLLDPRRLGDHRCPDVRDQRRRGPQPGSRQLHPGSRAPRSPARSTPSTRQRPAPCFIERPGPAHHGEERPVLAFDNAAGQTPTQDITGVNLAGQTYGPGVFNATGGILISGPMPLTLNGGGNADSVFIFQAAAGQDLTVDPTSQVVLHERRTALQRLLEGPVGVPREHRLHLRRDDHRPDARSH